MKKRGKYSFLFKFFLFSKEKFELSKLWRTYFSKAVENYVRLWKKLLKVWKNPLCLPTASSARP